MRSQIEKNRETLLEEIEKLSAKPVDNATAERLSAYRGAYKALCLVEHLPEEKTTQIEMRAARSVELDGDTEFEKLIVSMPFDMAHAKAVASIFADHMENLHFMNSRAYDNVMQRLRKAAEK